MEVSVVEMSLQWRLENMSMFVPRTFQMQCHKIGLTILQEVEQSYYNSSCTYTAQEQVNCCYYMEFHVVCAQAYARVVKVMNFWGWKTCAWMSVTVIYYITHGISFVQLINSKMTGNDESFNFVRLVVINLQVSYLFAYLID